MSADNYYMIRRHPRGGYAAVMGFASDGETPAVKPHRDHSFATIVEAFEWASDEYTEYGVTIHAEIAKDPGSPFGEALSKLDGTDTAALSLLTGIPRDEIEKLGGLPS